MSNKGLGRVVAAYDFDFSEPSSPDSGYQPTGIVAAATGFAYGSQALQRGYCRSRTDECVGVGIKDYPETDAIAGARTNAIYPLDYSLILCERRISGLRATTPQANYAASEPWQRPRCASFCNSFENARTIVLDKYICHVVASDL
jgi:hypothetical protein